ncbi:MAG: hypothetical protein HY727_09920 [Candidatus Rokubacteria bacterium]|nr:hypothetical protein [Candidatus Rokubacteria bacterium]
MDETPGGEGRERVGRWIEEGKELLELLPGLLDQHAGLRGRAEAAEQECEKLHQELAKLRLENQQYRTERDELAETFKRMTEVVQPVSEKLGGGSKASPFAHQRPAAAKPPEPT